MSYSVWQTTNQKVVLTFIVSTLPVLQYIKSCTSRHLVLMFILVFLQIYHLSMHICPCMILCALVTYKLAHIVAYILCHIFKLMVKSTHLYYIGLKFLLAPDLLTGQASLEEVGFRNSVYT